MIPYHQVLHAFNQAQKLYIALNTISVLEVRVEPSPGQCSNPLLIQSKITFHFSLLTPLRRNSMRGGRNSTLRTRDCDITR